MSNLKLEIIADINLHDLFAIILLVHTRWFDKTPKECKTVLEMPKTEDGQVQGAAEGGC